MITALDHIQLSMPEGREEVARDFFGRLLELEEIEKPPSLARRGGVWFALPDGRQVHLGVEKPFRPNEKAHPALVASPLDGLAQRLRDGGFPAKWDGELAPRRRFYSEDPFGNRLEFLEPISERI
jgi:catechol 2,3-dioxygenase-like lactoylglutathione lyase family enzyme